MSLGGYLAKRFDQRVLGEEVVFDASGAIRLDLNEGPFAPPPAAVEAMCEAAKNANRYPDNLATTLCQAIAKRLNVLPQQLVVACGTNELIATTAALFIDRDDEVIVPRPTFVGHVKTSIMQGATVVEVDVDPDGSINIGAMLARVTQKTKLIYITSPHNPTGRILQEHDFTRLIKELPDHVMLYLDEAYFEYGVRAGAPDYLKIIMKRAHPWITTRTFSKAYGLAGARVGYGIASSPTLAAAYRVARPNFTTNLIGMAGAIAALDEGPVMNEALSRIESERDRISTALSCIGCRVLPSGANFVMAILASPEAKELAARLASDHILVRPIEMPRGEAGLRVTVGAPADNDKFIEALRSYQSENAARDVAPDRPRVGGVDYLS